MTGWLILPYDGEGIGFLGERGFSGYVPDTEKTSVTALSNGVLGDGGERYYIRKLMNDSRVYVFGGGHLSQELVPLLRHLGFRCIVTDDRAEFSSCELFPDAEKVYTRAFTELDGAYDVRTQDYIVIVTRGHAADHDVEKWALTTPAHYIGAVGSRGKIAAVNARLKEDGFTDEQLSRVTSPIGIDINSETPAEIAVSIAAQLIEVRAGYNR